VKRKIFNIFFAVVLVLSFSLIMAVPAQAAVMVTPAAGGGAISADTAAGAPGAAWTSLGTITIAENANDDIAASQAGVTLILNAPAGFQFNAAQSPSISGPAGDITAITVTSTTAAAITITFSTDGAADALDTIVISQATAIQVQPTAGTPLLSGNIQKAAGSTCSIAGVDGTTNFGMLTEVAGAVATLTVVVQPSDALAGVAIAPPVQVKAEDVFDNVIAGQNITVTLQAGLGVLSGTTPQATNALGIATFNDLSIDTVGPGKVLRFTAAAKTVDSNPFSIVVLADIDVEWSGTSIADGDSTPSTADGTDFGSADISTPAR